MNKNRFIYHITMANKYRRVALRYADRAKNEPDEMLAMFYDSEYAENVACAMFHILHARKERIIL